jgi:hypothetical protein
MMRRPANERNAYASPNVADLHKPFNNRMRFDRQACGAIELAFMRGEHSGYLEGYRDAKRGRKSKWEDNERD